MGYDEAQFPTTKSDTDTSGDIDIAHYHKSPNTVTYRAPSVSFNKLILEPYVDSGKLESTIKSGIAMVQQKIGVKGLKVLINCQLVDGTLVQAGDKAYVKEENLKTLPWAKKLFTSDNIAGEFIIVSPEHIEYITPALR